MSQQSKSAAPMTIHRAAEDLLLDASQTLSWSIFSLMSYTAIALGLYAYASYKLSQEALPLEQRCHVLSDKLHELKKSTLELRQTVASLSDPAADEYALITELGMIPEGSRKMLLKPPPKNLP